MARRKSSTALFEVITTSPQRPERRATLARPSFSLRVPNWWRRGDGGDAPPAAVLAHEPTAFRAGPTDPTANVSAADLHAPGDVCPAVVPAPAVLAPPQAVAPVGEAERETVEPSNRPAGRSSTVDESEQVLSRSGMKVAFDADRQEVTLQMRYTSAIVSGFAVLVVIALAYIVGRRVSEGPQPAQAQPAAAASAAGATSASVKKGPVQSGVLAPTDKAAKPAPGGTNPKVGTPRESPVFLDAPLATDGTAERTSHMLYVIVQNYGPLQHKAAVDTRDFLTRNGVPCTIEKTLPRAAGEGWYTVIGTRGFPRNYKDLPAYDAYRKSIADLAPKAPDKSAFGRLQPLLYRW